MHPWRIPQVPPSLPNPPHPIFAYHTPPMIRSPAHPSHPTHPTTSPHLHPAHPLAQANKYTAKPVEERTSYPDRSGGQSVTFTVLRCMHMFVPTETDISSRHGNCFRLCIRPLRRGPATRSLRIVMLGRIYLSHRIHSHAYKPHTHHRCLHLEPALPQ